jgi:transcriptional regulator
MYTPKHFDEPEVTVLHQLMRERPLATLVTMGFEGPEANVIPLHLAEAEESSPGQQGQQGQQGQGVLRGHVARANPLWHEHPAETPVLAIFHGPDGYISPSWYATKAETGKVVPTWNYVVVHARGFLRVIEDPQWIRAQIDALTGEQEAGFARPWSAADAPADFIDKLLGAVVGIEIVITRLQGKWKLSQNQPLPNRLGVIQALEAMGTGESAVMADLIRQQGEDCHS